MNRSPQRHRWQSVHSLGAVVLLLAGTSGCVVGPDHVRPSSPVPDSWHQELEHGHYLNAAETRDWWTLFQDEQLNQLVYLAGENNLDLYAAYKRICQERAQLSAARSARWPNIDATTSVTNAKPSVNVINFFRGARFVWGTGFDVSWEPDLFGRVARQVESSHADYCASVETYRDLMVTLYADVARNYVELRTQQTRLEYALRNEQIQQQALELATSRVDGGVSPILDQHQAESNLASTQAEIPPLEAGIHQTLNRLAVLIGEYPRTLHCDLLAPGPIPVAPTDLPVAIPCDVVRQRPDIRQAERELASRTAQIGVAESDLYPRFAINGTFAWQSQHFNTLFNPLSNTYSVGPSFRWAIFQAGRIRANICFAECAAEEAFANYEQTLLRAAEEVENATVSYNNEVRRIEALRRSVEATEKSLKVVLDIYREGRTNFQNVLDTQRTLFLAQDQLAISEGRAIDALVSFYQALGGGWDPQHHCRDRCVRLHCPPNCPADVPNVVASLPDDAANQEDSDQENADQENADQKIPDLNGNEETLEEFYDRLDRYDQEFDRRLQKNNKTTAESPSDRPPRRDLHPPTSEASRPNTDEVLDLRIPFSQLKSADEAKSTGPDSPQRIALNRLGMTTWIR